MTKNSDGSGAPIVAGTRVESATLSARAVRRRRQIIDAARTCFTRNGFHSASMAMIAAQAGISVGHIYRYFPGKEAIIAAIVELHVETVLEDLPKIMPTPSETRLALTNHILTRACARDTSWASMMVEIRAEAARSPSVARMVREADLKLTDHFRDIIKAGFELHRAPTDLDERMAMIPMAIDGVNLRMMALPATPPAAVERLIVAVIAAAFEA